MTPGELLPDPSQTVRCITVCAQGQTHRLVTDQHPFQLLENQKSWSPPQDPPDLPSTPFRGWENTVNTGRHRSHIPTTPGSVAGQALTRKASQPASKGPCPSWGPLLGAPFSSVGTFMFTLNSFLPRLSYSLLMHLSLWLLSSFKQTLRRSPRRTSALRDSGSLMQPP